MVLFILLYIPKFIVTIVVIILLYYGIKFLSRFILPLLIDKGMKNMQQKMREQQRQQESKRPEGEVTIEGQPGQHKNKGEDKGEYIDFEEVD